MSISSDGLNLLMTALSQLNIKQNEAGQWYIDSGAATHVTSDVGKLLNLFPYTGHGSIVTGGETHHSISHIANTFLHVQNTKIPLSNVLVVLAIKKNILSVSKFVDNTNSSC